MSALQRVRIADYQPHGEILTYREIEVLGLAGRGLSVKGIARILGISSGTVSWHLKNTYQKLRVGCREDALKKARDLGLIVPERMCPVCACRLGSGIEEQVVSRVGAADLVANRHGELRQGWVESDLTKQLTQ